MSVLTPGGSAAVEILRQGIPSHMGLVRSGLGPERGAVPRQGTKDSRLAAYTPLRRFNWLSSIVS